MPCSQFLEFYYYRETQECQFSFYSDIENLAVTIIETSTGIIYYGEVSHENPVIYQALSSGKYHIICMTDDGDTYEGEDYIQ